MNIADIIVTNGEKFADRLAVKHEAQSFTYQDLDKASNQIANGLSQMGLADGDRVGLLLPNHPLFLAIYYGVQKVGAIAVLINPTLKEPEVQYILEDSQCVAVITTLELRPRVTASSQPRIILTEASPDPNQVTVLGLMTSASTTPATIDLPDEAPSTLFYTSGTTGQPKGVLLSHHNLWVTARLCATNFETSQDDRVLLFLPICHSFGLTTITNQCLYMGATLLLHPGFEAETILQVVTEQQVSMFFAVPTIYNILSEQATARHFESVRLFVSAGAKLPLEIARTWQTRYGLGISEGLGFSEGSLVALNKRPNEKLGSVGHVFEGIKLKLVDTTDQPVAQGVRGEIAVRGPNVMLGYWEQPEETATAIKDGWFYTGDIGVMDGEGDLYVVDRKKDMVNVAGQKVYPSEVEQVLYRHPAVAEVAVYGVPEPTLGEQVRANIILKSGQTVTVDEIIDFCQASLADYKLPSVIEFVESLPKGKTGKILKRVLREEAEKRLPPATSQALSRSAAEIRIWLHAWLTSHLGEGDITSDRPFSDYGLTSVLAVNMITALNEWLGSSLAPIVAWNYPTIEKLVSYITSPELQHSQLFDNQISSTEPIAIIGMGCRFPSDADTPDKFWDILKEGLDTVTDIPAERWDVDAYYDAHKEAIGKMYVKAGSFLKNVAQFDASFFGIPPLEASSLDPQQRLLIELCWEALEQAGLAPDRLRHTQTGVYIGSHWDDYSTWHLYQSNLAEIDAYRTLSHLRGMSAGRLAYLLGLHGPAMQLDTACSSSLLAVHLACQSLRMGECQLAIAGGVTLMLSPEQMIGLCRMQALSPDGRSKSFAAGADGFGVGEGAGLVILKRLSEAVADGDTILAVIKGSAVNHDGPSNGLTAPNGLAQEMMLQQALKQAQVSPHQIDYIETHGTGTELGDPIEVGALANMFASNRDRPLLIGSVKSNIGHLSAAAGVASLIKVVLALQHGLIPPNLHFDEPNPHIPWSEIPFTVPTELTPWPAPNGQPRLAGISSFGLTGTNVHVVVAEAPAPVEVVSEQTRPQHLLTLSGKTEQALADQVAQYQRYLKQHDGLNLGDVCYTSTVGRVHFEQRLGVVAAEMAELQQKLAVYQSGELPLGMAQGVGQAEKPKVAFLFPGQGPQYAAMGRELYETQPVFREIMDDCDQILQSYWDKSMLEILYGADEASNDQLLDEATYAQPALFAIEYALAKLWQSWGIEPEVVIGHSMGEYAAACFAGVFSLADGLKLIAERGRLMQEEAEAGQMVAVLASAEEVAPVIEPFAAEVSIGVINTPQNLVISGRPSGVKKAVETLEAAGIETRQLKIYVASHSPLMDGVLDKFEAVVDSIACQRPQIKVVSNLTGTVVAEELTTPGYWRQHLRNSVQFAQGMATLAELGIDTFIEVGPKPTLLGMGQQCLPEAQAVWLPSLYPKQQGDWAQLLSSVGQFHVQGGRVDWAAVHQPYAYHKVSLPTYPFQRKRYWLDRKPQRAGQVGDEHPLLGTLRHLPLRGEISFQSELSTLYPAYLKEHRIYEQVVVPEMAYLEMVLGAGKEVFSENTFVIKNINFQQPLVLTEQAVTLQLLFMPLDIGYQWQIFSQGAMFSEWITHCTGEIVPDTVLVPKHGLAEIQKRCQKQRAVDEHYLNLAGQGVSYGPEFQGVTELYQGDGEWLGLVRLSEGAQLEAPVYQLHPALWVACLQVAQTEAEETVVPSVVDELRWYGGVNQPDKLWSHVRLREDNTEGAVEFDLMLLAETGELVAELVGLRLEPAKRQAILGTALRTDWLYQLSWETGELPQFSAYEGEEAGRWLLISELSSPMTELAQRLQAQGETVELISPDEIGQQDDYALYRGVVYLAASGEDSVPQIAAKISGQLLELLQGIVSQKGQPRVWLVTVGAVGEMVTHPEQAVLWGLARTVMWEHPELQCRCLDIMTETTAETLFETIWYADEENQISLTGTERQVARLARYQPELGVELTLNPEGSYLITGGMDDLGLNMAAWLVEQGASHLVLSSRRGAVSETAQAVIAELEAQGATVQVIKADVSEEADVVRLLAESQKQAPLAGIIHAAGVLDEGILLEQTAERFATVFAPKVAGSWYLHQHSMELPLDFFICFSTASALLGAVGQCSVAAANGFTDALMHTRRAMGLPGLSINWGSWAEIGSTLVEEPMTFAQGSALLEVILTTAVSQVGVLPIRWVKLSQALPMGTEFPLFAQYLPDELRLTMGSKLLQQLTEATIEERPNLLKEHIRREIEFVVGIMPTDDEQGFFDMGMDSLMSIQLVNRLGAALDSSLPGTLTLEYPTVGRLSSHLLAMLFDTEQTVMVSSEEEMMPSTEISQELAELEDIVNSLL